MSKRVLITTIIYMITAEYVKNNLRYLPQLVFEVTDACNLHCKYCGYAEFYGGYDKRVSQNLTIDKAKQILNYLFDFWEQDKCEDAIRPMCISFYGGEPLLNMKLVSQIVEYVSSRNDIGRKFIFGMTTNAMLLNRYADYLAEHEFRLLISLDGDENGQSYRVDHNGNNSFERVVRNVKELQSNHTEYFENFVMFNSVLHNRNNVESILHFIKDNFNKVPSISQLNTSGILPSKRDEFWNTFQSYTESIMQSSNCEALQEELFIKNPMTGAVMDLIHYESGNVYSSYNHLLISPKNDIATHLTGTCTPFSKKLFVTVNGKILPCERIDHVFSLGTVTDEKVDLNFELIASKYNRMITRYRNQCLSCGYKGRCRKCVYHDDNIMTEKPVCQMFTSEANLDASKKEALRYLRHHPYLYYNLLTNVVIR